MATFGEKLRLAYESRGLTQGKLAKLYGCTQPQVNDWVSGKTRVYLDQAGRFAEILEVSLDYLGDDRIEGPPEAAPGEKERLVREIVGRKGWEWIYWRIVESPAETPEPEIDRKPIHESERPEPNDIKSRRGRKSS